MEADIKELLGIKDDHSTDLLYYRNVSDSMKFRISELEQALLKNYVNQADANFLLDKIIQHPHAQKCYREVFESVSKFDIYNTEKIIKFILKLVDINHGTK